MSEITENTACSACCGNAEAAPQNTGCENTSESTCSCSSAEKSTAKCAFNLPKLNSKDKRRLVKHGMIASLAVTALSGFLPVPYGKKVHTAAGLTFLGLCALHTYQNTPKKK